MSRPRTAQSFVAPAITHLALLALLLLAAGPALAAPAAQDLFQGEERQAVRAETERLAAIQARHQDSILALPGVHGMGISVDRETRELVFLVAIEPDAILVNLPTEIEGVRVVVDRSEPATVANGGSACIPCHADQRPLPVEMGNSTGNGLFCSACTLGFKVCQEGTHYYVTNAHCSFDASGCEGGAPIGSSTYHRGQLDASCGLTSVIGSVTKHKTPNCASSYNRVDGALIASSNSSTSWSIRDIGTPATSPGWTTVGDAVHKSGRTTGYTTGTVGTVNYTANVGGYCCGTARFVEQIRVDATVAPFIQGGDSGSALLRQTATPSIVGLLFAGPGSGAYGIANPIDEVLYSLSSDPISLDPTCHPIDPACEYDCYMQHSDCREDACYWDPDPYMCQTGCDEELDECLLWCMEN